MRDTPAWMDVRVVDAPHGVTMHDVRSLVAEVMAVRALEASLVAGVEDEDVGRKMAPVLLFAPNYTLCDIYYAIGYGDFAADRMYNEIAHYDARNLGPDFQVPMFIFNGDHDAITPSELARPWLDTLRAPKKDFVSLPGGGHSALLTMGDEFLREMVARVRPVAR